MGTLIERRPHREKYHQRAVEPRVPPWSSEAGGRAGKGGGRARRHRLGPEPAGLRHCRGPGGVKRGGGGGGGEGSRRRRRRRRQGRRRVREGGGRRAAAMEGGGRGPASAAATAVPAKPGVGGGLRRPCADGPGAHLSFPSRGTPPRPVLRPLERDPSRPCGGGYPSPAIGAPCDTGAQGGATPGAGSPRRAARSLDGLPTSDREGELLADSPRTGRDPPTPTPASVAGPRSGPIPTPPRLVSITGSRVRGAPVAAATSAFVQTRRWSGEWWGPRGRAPYPAGRRGCVDGPVVLRRMTGLTCPWICRKSEK